jgi:hypothetical protein
MAHSIETFDRFPEVCQRPIGTAGKGFLAGFGGFTMRRRKLLVVLAGLAVLAVGAFLLWPRPDRITRDYFQRIRIGMGRAEVEAILGGPPGDYTTLNVSPHIGMRIVVDMDDDGTIRNYPPEEWTGNTMSIWVSFGPSGKVISTSYEDSESVKEWPWDNLRWRFWRQWRKWFPK